MTIIQLEHALRDANREIDAFLEANPKMRIATPRYARLVSKASEIDMRLIRMRRAAKAQSAKS